jgi:MFS transporter, ACS family, hexuronate transporter
MGHKDIIPIRPAPPSLLMSAPEQAQAQAVAPSVGHYRWTICALLFLATTMNYMDRQILGLLAPVLQKSIGWNELQYGYIVTAFQAAYAIGLLAMGSLIDRIGARIGYALSIGIWSLSAAAHALVKTPLGFGAARFALGLGEAGNFPAGIKTVAEWFPKKERALATGVFNSGSNLGAAIAPLFVLRIADRFGWQSAFLVTAALSTIPLVLWIMIYRPPAQHPRLSAGELGYIRSGPAEPVEKVPWSRLLSHRQTWSFVIGKFLTDPIWWFLLFWAPKFLSENHGLPLLALGLPLVIIYNAACAGSIFGGWIAARFLKRGWTLNRARKVSMLICAIAVVPIAAAANVQNLWTAVALLSLAAAAHQGWSANLFTLASDLFPQRAVGSVVGIGGFGGAIGGLFIAAFTGWVLQFTRSYVPMFVIAGSVYLLALALIHILTPDLRPAALDSAGLAEAQPCR